jgi:VCBS repeat-containing protein
MSLAAERIVVQATAEDKQAIVAKAGRLGLPISELMRRGAFAYSVAERDAELDALADAAHAAAERAIASIDDTLAFIEASNKRIDAMQAKASRAALRRAA